MHVSRMWSGNDKDRFPECICNLAACGMVIPDVGCPQHDLSACKTLRRMHAAKDCPAERKFLLV